MTNEEILDDEYLEAQKEYHRQLHQHSINPEDEKAYDQLRQDALEEYREQLHRDAEHRKNNEEYKKQVEIEQLEIIKEFGILKPQVITEDISDNFGELGVKRDDSPTGLDSRAELILSKDPMRFLLNDLQHRVEGDERNIKIVILGFMSMHSQIKTLLHQQIIGQSGGGKSYLVLECRKILWETHTLPWTELSPKAINYYCSGDEDHSPQTIANKLLFLDDVSDKDIPLLKTLGNNDGNNPQGMVAQEGGILEYTWDGYPLTIISKVSPLEDEGGQISSRYLTYNIEESTTHTETILDKQRTEEVSNIGRIEMDPVCQYITFKCLTLPINRIQLCQYEFPPQLTSRNHKFYQTLIKCNALLNHKNRTILDKTLYVSPEDVAEATKLWAHISTYNNEKLSKVSIDILSILKPKNDLRGRESTISGLAEALNASNPTITKYLDKMVRTGLIGSTQKNPRVFYIL